VRPGLSVCHQNGTAGTLGAIVYDRSTSQPLILSNWHVLAGSNEKSGQAIVQPGPYDNSDVENNVCGRLVRSHLGLAGDCAVASIEGRDFDASILELDRTPKQTAAVELDDKVVKSGRTTGVTRGVVSRIGVIIKLNYGGSVGTRRIGGFEIVPDPDFPAERGEISMGGDSGSLWMIAEEGEEAADVAVGLHFAGETDPAPEAEHAIACDLQRVLDRLEVDLEDPNSTELDDETLFNHILTRLAALETHVGALRDQIGNNVSTRPSDEQPPTKEEPHQFDATPEAGLPVYGNWCGPGHGGGTPVDDLDKACMKHDKCYDRNGYFDCDCDRQLKVDVARAMARGRLKPAGYLAGPAVIGWFNMQPCISHSAINKVKKTTSGVWKKITSWF